MKIEQMTKCTTGGGYTLCSIVQYAQCFVEADSLL